jgi:hypothetical protein
MSGRLDDVADPDDPGGELDELLGAYALDAVDDDEAERVEDYLRAEPRAAAEVRQHREVATMLAFTGTDAPDHVWERIERELDQSPPRPGAELAKVMAVDDRRSRRFGAVGPWLAAAAAAVLVAVVAVVVVDRAEAPADPIAEAFAQARDAPDAQTATLTAAGADTTAEGVVGADGRGFVDARPLPRLATGRTYQLWGVMADTSDVISLGILGPEPALETFTVEGDVVALAVTIESSPGVVSDGNPDGAFVGEF